MGKWRDVWQRVNVVTVGGGGKCKYKWVEEVGEWSKREGIIR